MSRSYKTLNMVQLTCWVIKQNESELEHIIFLVSTWCYPPVKELLQKTPIKSDMSLQLSKVVKTTENTKGFISFVWHDLQINLHFRLMLLEQTIMLLKVKIFCLYLILCQNQLDIIRPHYDNITLQANIPSLPICSRIQKNWSHMNKD